MKPWISSISYVHYQPYVNIKNGPMRSRDPWCCTTGGRTMGGHYRRVVYASMLHCFDVYSRDGIGFMGRVRMYTK
mgnify:CR=1 FL=1|jgi:hypothetical protein